MCDLEDMGSPSILRVIVNTATLVRMLSTFDLSCLFPGGSILRDVIDHIHFNLLVH